VEYKGKQETNHTKKYLQQIKQKIPQYTVRSQEEMKELMRIIAQDIGLDISEYHPAFSALSYIL